MKEPAKETAAAILETAIPITLAGKEYHAPRATLATLIEVSRLLSNLPNIELFDTDSITEKKIVEASKKGLFYARDCEAIATVVATLILGYKKKKSARWRWTPNYELKRTKLALKIANNCTIEELIAQSQKLLSGLDAASFFVFIASLSAINLMGEATKTTPSGQ